MIRNKLLISFLLITSFIIIRAAEEKYGKEITLKEKTSVSSLLSDPEKFEGKTILVEGTVVGVCSSRGCWIDIVGENDGEKIKVKVEDGVIVFPQDAKGKTALVEGVLSPVAGEACDDEHSESEEGGSCCSKEAKTKVYQIQGLGAVIK